MNPGGSGGKSGKGEKWLLIGAQRSARRQGLGPAGIEPTKPRIGDQVPNKRPGPAQNRKNKKETRDLYLAH